MTPQYKQFAADLIFDAKPSDDEIRDVHFPALRAKLEDVPAAGEPLVLPLPSGIHFAETIGRYRVLCSQGVDPLVPQLYRKWLVRADFAVDETP